ncbi:MAG: hypothetical protein ACK5HR_06485 [Mycoplasmatales bacterium]
MQQFETYKRAYYGYFITFIRVDIYNKIILKAVLEDKSNLNYNQLNLENSLKNELQKKHKMHYFTKYFNYRKQFYEKFYAKYPYTVYETIDLIYEYRNYLLDDASRIELHKFPLIRLKTLAQKEQDIQRIITLLLSEKLLEKYSTYIQDITSQQTILDYQTYFFSQDSNVIEYRKYLNKYFGYTVYNNKLTFLQRYLVGLDVSLAKKYQLLIAQYISLNTLSEKELTFFTDLDIKVTADYLSGNCGLLEIKVPLNKDNCILLSYNQLFILYFLKKQDNEFSIAKFLKFLEHKQLKKSYNNKPILSSKDIYEYKKTYFAKLQNSPKIMKYLSPVNKEINATYLLKLLTIKRALNNNVKNLSKYLNTKIFEQNLLAVELITGHFDKKNLSKSIKNYLNIQYQNVIHKQEEIFSIFNQMKFTTNINTLNKIQGFNTKSLYNLQKDYKVKKKELAEKYIETIHILITLRVHKYNKDKSVLNAYIYRNNVMHFEKEMHYTKYTRRIILKELKKIATKEQTLIKELMFDKLFFNLLKIKD